MKNYRQLIHEDIRNLGIADKLFRGGMPVPGFGYLKG